MQQTKHAEEMVNRFRTLVEDAGDSLSVNHYNELKLIIEAGLVPHYLKRWRRLPAGSPVLPKTFSTTPSSSTESGSRSGQGAPVSGN